MSGRVKLTNKQMDRQVEHLRRIFELKCAQAIRAGQLTDNDIADIHRAYENQPPPAIGDIIELDGGWYSIDGFVADGVILNRVRAPRHANIR